MRLVYLCTGLLVFAACGGERSAQRNEPAVAARVVIARPADGDSVGSDVHVVLQAEGIQVVAADGQHTAGRGHHHLFIDTDPTPPGSAIPAGVPGIVHIGTGATEWDLTGLTPGAHRIIAVLAYGDHVPMEGVATDTVRVIVRE